MADNNKSIITIGPFPFFPDFRFQFPNPLHRKPQPSHRIVASDDRTDDKPDAVKFTERKPAPAPPLQLEVDEPSNPLITYSGDLGSENSELKSSFGLTMAAECGKMAVAEKDEEGAGETKLGLFSFLPKVNLPNPFFNRAVETASSPSSVGEREKEIEAPKPNVVRFPNARPVVPPPMEVEVEESSHKTHNPIIIWQVYAIGGFIILKWVWARWNERKERAKKGSSSEENRSPEYESPGEGED